MHTPDHDIPAQVRRQLAEGCRAAEAAHKASGVYKMSEIEATAHDLGGPIDAHLARYVDSPLETLITSFPGDLRRATVPRWYEDALVQSATDLLGDLVDADVRATVASSARAEQCRRLAKAGGVGLGTDYNKVVLQNVGTFSRPHQLFAVRQTEGM
jgi:hypothetical protein